MRYHTMLTTFIVGVGLLNIDGMSTGVGLILVLMVIISLQIDKQQDDIRELATSMAFIALVLKGHHEGGGG